ncbi:MAG: hypothetical protein GY679_02160 [Mycoplasma sp.]|nr:hypothetical protein [Mycoplasma sp.]
MNKETKGFLYVMAKNRTEEDVEILKKLRLYENRIALCGVVKAKRADKSNPCKGCCFRGIGRIKQRCEDLMSDCCKRKGGKSVIFEFRFLEEVD